MTDLPEQLRQLADDIEQYGKDRAHEHWEADSITGRNWRPCATLPNLLSNKPGVPKYRRKPKPIVINGVTIEEPMREAPNEGMPVWVVDLYRLDGVSVIHWDEFNNRHFILLKGGFIHGNHFAASKHAEALRSFTRSFTAVPGGEE